MSDNEVSPPDEKAPALRRAELMSRSLAETARRFRMSKRSRRAFGTGTFRMRRHARLFRTIFMVSFALVVVAPTLTAGAYFGLIASPQYVAEAKFAVRTGELPKIDGMGALTGMPLAKIAQDTQVVTSYMESRALVDALEQRIGLRSLYSADDVDWFARFDREKSIEKLVKYWKSMTDTRIQIQSGIVDFTVRAFSAEDAKRIADTVIELSEALVNDMNGRMLRATVADAEREFERSAERLSRARIEYQKVRNTEGTLDATQQGKALGDLITALQGERLRLQQEYETQLKYVATSAPQMRTLSARLGALKDQIAELEAKLTTQRVSTAADSKVLSESLTKFAQQDLERRVAERQYAVAAAALEMARIASERQLVYLATFVRPSLPQESRYPRPILFTTLTLLGAFTVWAALCAAITGVRNHMA
ncbi:lipopolysaccharide biosynthesis protein [Vineibacter terrae]|uniref:Lipopolysaccharide biosynthesis protein n=1 Tax=Vineibacter terrae TaxID=2586908 RepID=A0A5C8PMM5_9HYPH|nr:lipopolysaccharide biosynthesis protein [Vineibacter terrae]TXL75679.1 lipopolysaccharide biosynthesis protein [Vineibacter terrae]